MAKWQKSEPGVFFASPSLRGAALACLLRSVARRLLLSGSCLCHEESGPGDFGIMAPLD